jgi:hypothetical protein
MTSQSRPHARQDGEALVLGVQSIEEPARRRSAHRHVTDTGSSLLPPLYIDAKEKVKFET